MDKNKIKVIRGFIVLGVVLFAVVMHIPEIYSLLQKVYGIISPVLFGLIVAFVLNAPISKFEILYSKIKIRKKPLNDRTVSGLAFVTTMILLLAVVALASILIFPNVIESASSLIEKIKVEGPQWIEWLEDHGIDTAELQAKFTHFDLSQFTNHDGIISWVLTTVTSALGGILTFIITVAIALYALLDKKNLGKVGEKASIAFLSPKWSARISDCFRRLQKSYSNFFSAQCLESLILGTFMFITLTIFRVPYAGLIAVLTAIFAFVPYVGAWLACGVGCILMLVSDPSKILTCILVYTVTQMIENYFIYPHVVGNKVELSPLVTLSSVVIGGSMFGVFGMIMFIPLMVVVRDLFVQYLDKKVEAKGTVQPPKSEEKNHNNSQEGDSDG